MASKKKSKKENNDKWAVVHYPANKLVSVCHSSEVNEDDDRVKIISEHTEVDKAMEEQIKYAKSKKLTAQY